MAGSKNNREKDRLKQTTPSFDWRKVITTNSLVTKFVSIYNWTFNPSKYPFLLLVVIVTSDLKVLGV
jgi:hypothetical protein